MSYLANGHADTLPVPGDKNGATVTFRADVTLDDEFKLSKLAREIRERITDNDEAGVAYRLARVLYMIESWTLVDRGGNPLPQTPDTLRSGLRKRVATWIEKEANARYDGRSEDEEGPFDSPSQQPSTGTR